MRVYMGVMHGVINVWTRHRVLQLKWSELVFSERYNLGDKPVFKLGRLRLIARHMDTPIYAHRGGDLSFVEWILSPALYQRAERQKRAADRAYFGELLEADGDSQASRDAFHETIEADKRRMRYAEAGEAMFSVYLGFLVMVTIVLAAIYD